ncbi:unnamed protein product [Cochlearia groenlandica]
MSANWGHVELTNSLSANCGHVELKLGAGSYAELTNRAADELNTSSMSVSKGTDELDFRELGSRRAQCRRTGSKRAGQRRAGGKRPRFWRTGELTSSMSANRRSVLANREQTSWQTTELTSCMSANWEKTSPELRTREQTSWMSANWE